VGGILVANDFSLDLDLVWLRGVWKGNGKGRKRRAKSEKRAGMDGYMDRLYYTALCTCFLILMFTLIHFVSSFEADVLFLVLYTFSCRLDLPLGRPSDCGSF
jgi:hypothetical protein